MPSYGILAQNIAAPQNVNHVGSLLSGLQAAHDIQGAKLRNQLAVHEGELKKTEMARRQKELEYLPTQQAREAELHNQALAMNNLKMRSAQQDMQTDALRQKHMQDQARYNQISKVNELTGTVLSAPEEQRGAAWKSALASAKAAGLPTDNLPQQWDENAQAYAQNAYVHSGRALQEAKLMKGGQGQLIKAVGPDGTAIYVPQNQAAGMQVYEPSAMNASKQEDKEYRAAIKEASQQALSAGAVKDNISAFMSAAKKIPTGTGPWAGRVAFLSKEGQEAIKYSSQLALEELQKMKGATSDRDLDFIKSATLSVTNDYKSNEKIAKLITLKASQYQQKPQFMQALRQKGIKDPALAETLWSQYVSDNPLVNRESGQMRDNIPSWKKYTEKEYLSGAELGSAIEPEGQQQTAQAEAIVVGKNGQRYKKVDGGYVPV